MKRRENHDRAHETRDRIVILIARREDRNLLVRSLDRRYDVHTTDAKAEDVPEILRRGGFDLVLVDGPTLDAHARAVSTIRSAEQEVFLPFLLITSRRNVGLATSRCRQLVDEVIFSPVQEIELHTRLEILLRARRYSRRLQDRYFSSAEIAPTGILLVDHDGTIDYVNQQAELLFARPRSELVGRNASHLFGSLTDPGGRKLPADAWPHRRVLLTRGPVYDQRMAFARQDGRTVHVSANGVPLPSPESGNPGGVVLTLKDVSEQEAYEQGLREARDRAEEMNRLKTSFLANISHEIRTPLTGILASSELIAEEAGSEMQEFAEHVRRSGNRLLETLNAVLDLAQLESGSWPIAMSPVDLIEVLDEEVASVRPPANSALDLQFERPREATTIRTDRSALKTILHHLLSNAVKFTPEGRVSVCIRSHRNSLEVEISDTGIGISEAFLPYVFDEFRQESEGLGRVFEGSGLGLAIANRLAALLGGSIGVESEKGVGSVFTVCLPARAHPDEGGDDSASNSTPRSGGRKPH